MQGGVSVESGPEMNNAPCSNVLTLAHLSAACSLTHSFTPRARAVVIPGCNDLFAEITRCKAIDRDPCWIIRQESDCMHHESILTLDPSLSVYE